MTYTPESDKAKIAFTLLFANDDAYLIPYTVGMKLERERDEARGQLSAAKREAEYLATSIHRSEYSNVAPNWGLCDSVAGVISQIDNMYAGVRAQRDEARNEILGLKNKWDCAIDMAARAGNALDEMTLRWERTNDALFNERALAELDSSSPSDETACSVCEDALKRLGGHKESRLDGDAGLAAATMRSYEALLRVCDLLEAWKATLTSRATAGLASLRLKESIAELEAAIRPPQVQ